MTLCVLFFSLTVDLVTYITRFQWDMAKYPIKQSLKNISEIISKVFGASAHLLLYIKKKRCSNKMRLRYF